VAERAGDYSACGGDFYARGHIRAIAKAAGAAPEPLIREFDVTRQIPQALTLADIFHDTPATPIMAGTVATLKPDGRGRRQPLRRAGGAIGLALLGTVAWTAVADSIRTQVAHAAAAAAQAGRPVPKPGTAPPASIYNHALTVGFSRAFDVAAGIGLLALLIGIVTIRVSRQELAAAVPEPQAAAPQPATLERHEDQAALASAVRPCWLC